MFTMKERVLAGITLIIAMAGQINASLFGEEIFGLSAQKTSVLLYIPMGVVLFSLMKKYRENN
ncbi:MAG TPA: hypothetical protein VKQ29_01405 [Aliidongia sp.]|nr:hypothetical protein [Aliidongia sp.]